MTIERKDVAAFMNQWGFKTDPFSEKYPFYDGFWALPQRDINIVTFLIDNIPEQKAVFDVLVKGEYGSGKTYALQYLSSHIQKDLNGVAIYFQIQPKHQVRGFVDVYTDIIRNITAERLITIGKKIREEKGIKELPEFERYLMSNISNRDVVRAIVNFTFGVESALTWNWLKAESSVSQQRSLGFEESPKDSAIALQVILGLIDFLLLHYNIVGICIDEMENIVGESRAVRSIREGVRNFLDLLVYDRKARSVALITSVTSEFVYDIQQHMGTPLLDRVDRVLELKPLTDDDAKVFVQKVFALARQDVNATAITPPFANNQAFAAFLTHSKVTSLVANLGKKGIVTPRRIAKAGKYLLQTACFDLEKSITVDYVEKIFKEE